jgi:hypothetical protein
MWYRFVWILWYGKNHPFFWSTIVRRPTIWRHQNSHRARSSVELLMSKPSYIKKGARRTRWERSACCSARDGNFSSSQWWRRGCARSLLLCSRRECPLFSWW